MLITLAVLGCLVVIVFVIRGSGLQEFGFYFKFRSDGSPRKQIEK